jgi:hypothetical protein
MSMRPFFFFPISGDLSFVQDDTLVACVLNQLDCMCNSYVGMVTMRRAAVGLISTSLVSGMFEPPP